MATKAQLEAVVNNPNVRKFLDLIAQSEGTTTHQYNTTFGGGRFNDLSKHPNIQRKFPQTDGKVNSSGAAGRYQFIYGTWNSLSKRYGLSDFSPRNQDLGALALIAEKGQLDNVVKGNYKEAVRKLGSVWASFPSSTYAQNKHDWNTIDKMWANAGGTPVADVSTGHTSVATQTPNPNTSTNLFDFNAYANQQIASLNNTQTKPQAETQTQDLFNGISNSPFNDKVLDPFSYVGGLNPMAMFLGENLFAGLGNQSSNGG